MNYTDLPDGLLINSQRNLNPKVQFKTLALLGNLGTANVLAWTYYDGMRVFCEEDNNWYIWREKQTPVDSVGVVVGDYTYPSNFVSFSIDYSGKTYNFFPLNISKTIRPHGVVQVLKISTSASNEVIEAGDYVVNSVLTNDDFLIFGVYVSGDVGLEASYDASSIQILKF